MERSALFLRLPAWLDNRLRARAEQLNTSPQEYIRGLLTASLDPVPTGRRVTERKVKA